MRFRDARKPGQCRGAIAAGKIGFAEGKIGIRPFRLEASGFAEVAKLGIVIGGNQSADVMLEGVETQRTLFLGEFVEAEGINALIGGKRAPDETGGHVHKRIEAAAFANDTPTSSDPTRPGPCVTAIAPRSCHVTSAS